MAGLKCLRHLAWYLILTVRINYHARCRRTLIPATPYRGTNMSCFSKRNTNLDYGKNACLFFLLGVARLECVRHQARWFILTVRINYRARRLTPSPGVGHRIGDFVGYFTRNFLFVFVYTTSSYFLLLLGAPPLEKVSVTGRSDLFWLSE